MPDHARKRREAQRMSEVMPQLMARRGYARLLSHNEYQEVWQQISGRLAEHSHPGQLRGGVLRIIVSSSVAMQELMFEKRRLLKQLNDSLPHQKIRDLCFTVGTIE
jgi:predicted nucleic acid-binding Zn ribbon protein